MIFKSEQVAAQWDTWCYHHAGTWYLYYLITESSAGEGFGVATSADGVHWEDHGWAIRASDDMVRYLGTGSVWRDPAADGRFLCNYSEWRPDDEGEPRQLGHVVGAGAAGGHAQPDGVQPLPLLWVAVQT